MQSCSSLGGGFIHPRRRIHLGGAAQAWLLGRPVGLGLEVRRCRSPRRRLGYTPAHPGRQASSSGRAAAGAWTEAARWAGELPAAPPSRRISPSTSTEAQPESSDGLDMDRTPSIGRPPRPKGAPSCTLQRAAVGFGLWRSSTARPSLPSRPSFSRQALTRCGLLGPARYDDGRHWPPTRSWPPGTTGRRPFSRLRLQKICG